MNALTKDDQASEELQLVSFNLNEEEYGIDNLKVQEINRMLEITRVPNAPTHVVGVITLKGKVIPVVDLRQRFCMEPKETELDLEKVLIN